LPQPDFYDIHFCQILWGTLLEELDEQRFCLTQCLIICYLGPALALGFIPVIVSLFSIF
jgi:hypothetical protein